MATTATSDHPAGGGPGRAGGLLGGLRDDPERGPALALAVLFLTITVSLIEARFQEEWGDLPHVLVSGLAALAALAVAILAPVRPHPDLPDRRPGGGPQDASAQGVSGPPDDETTDRPGPPTWLSVILVAGWWLGLLALGNLAELLGAEESTSSGTLTWVGALLTGATAYMAWRRNSAICTLLAALTAIVTVLAFVDWVFDLDDPLKTFRWVLVVLAAGLGAAGFALRVTSRRHAVSFINAAGVAMAVLGTTFLVEGAIGAFAGALGGNGGGDVGATAGWGWEMLVLGAGLALIAYAVLDREPGPGYLGAINLLLFVGLAGGPEEDDKATLIGWPLLLLLLTVAAIAIALRPGGGLRR